MKSLSGQIRQIKWGIIPGLPYLQIRVDQDFGGTKSPMRVIEIVSEPVKDEKCDYHVQCCLLNDKKEVPKNDKGEPVGVFIWKTYKKEPDEIEYFAPDEAHNFLIAR